MKWAYLPLLLVAVPATARELPTSARPTQASLSPSSESPEVRLVRARQAYLNSDFRGTIVVARDLLYPEVQLRREEDVLAAHRLLALAYFLSRAEEASEREFNVILSLQPDFALDAVLDPPPAIAFLDRIKTRQRQRLDDIERQKREDAAAAAREDDLRRQQEKERLVREAEERVRATMKPVVVAQHNRWLCLLPLGVGQFQNGQTAKGAAFLTTQIAISVASVAIWGQLQLEYEFGSKKVPSMHLPNSLELNPAYVSVAVRQWTAVALGGLFWIDVGWGIIDAFAHYKPQAVLSPSGAPQTLHLPSLVPYMPPGGGAGLSLQGAF